MATLLKLYDGSTLLDLNDGATWSVLENWRPRVAGRRRTTLGGRTPYEEIVESIPLNLRASSIDLLLDQLEELTQRLDQAYNFSQGASVPAVVLRYRPNGSTYGSDLEATVIETGRDRIGEIILPADFAQQLSRKNVDLTLRVQRRGLWLGDEETDDSGADVVQPGVMTVSGGFTESVSLLSPAYVEVKFGGISSRPPDFSALWMIFAGAADKLILQECESLTATGYTNVQDIPAIPSGGANRVLRYTPTVTTPKESAGANLTIDADARLFAVYGVVRNNTSGKNYTARILAYAVGSALINGEIGATRLKVLPYTDGNPEVVAFGIFATSEPLGGVAIELTAAATGGTIDVDFIVVQVLDDEASAVVWSAPDISRGTALVSPAEDAIFVLDHALLSQLTPDLYVDFDDLSFRPGYQGDGLIMMRDELAGVVLTAGPQGDPTLFRFSSTADAQITVTRRAGFLAPR